jgi:hypothetical protein
VSAPKRVRLSGNLYHPITPPGAVDITRGTPWGNPFKVKAFGLEGALQQFQAYLFQRPALLRRARRELAGYDLACWCPIGQDCHGDVWLKIANEVPS